MIGRRIPDSLNIVFWNSNELKQALFKQICNYHLYKNYSHKGGTENLHQMYVIGDSHWEEKQMNQVTENLYRTQKQYKVSRNSEEKRRKQYSLVQRIENTINWETDKYENKLED
jgi:hypothetical protein